MALAITAGMTAIADDKAAEKRAKIDAMAAETLGQLVGDNAGAAKLKEQAYGYAVFSNVKVSLLITGGGGSGVAVGGGKRTYMRMGTGGLNIGLGGQKYQVVFLFENKSTFDNFVEKGWQADASANAVAGKAGVNAEATFRNGIAVYQLTDAGLMLQADISGTKYWKAKKLN
jgi:lipid-binding SYLF domain-containing protein